jgi:hypothetical protein
MHQSIAGYRGARYLWIALILSAVSVAVYLLLAPPGSRDGSPWVSYGLGTLGAALIVWLMLLGIRKRSYSSGLGTVQGWTSAHVYLGAALLVVVTLHSAWQLGWNVHTLAYLLTCLVVLSGFFGVYTYLRYPDLVVENRSGMTREQLFRQVDDLDRQCIRTAGGIDSETKALVQSAAERTGVGGGWWSQLTGRDSSRVALPTTYASADSGGLIDNSDQTAVIDLLSKRLAQTKGGSEVAQLQSLLSGLATKQTLLRRVRRDIRLQGLLEIWLYVHVPLSFALLAALLAHVLSVFIYW